MLEGSLFSEVEGLDYIVVIRAEVKGKGMRFCIRERDFLVRLVDC